MSISENDSFSFVLIISFKQGFLNHYGVQEGRQSLKDNLPKITSCKTVEIQTDFCLVDLSLTISKKFVLCFD